MSFISIKTKEETAIDIKKNECIFLFNDPAFNCDVYLTINYCNNIFNQLIKKESAYLNQKEKAEEALYGEAIIYRQPVNILIDSGAVGCIISKRFLEKVNKEIKLPTNIKIIDVIGQ
ncbi:hypothetical protein RhiirA4_479528 [Rhizophagus irregularis]|uniref:Uncharacterized protein n=1 Tax=Rhizophagus irregularis TaxID=588596 RepID=A0A2I1HGI3_9GLOM|nr:hypothetical protein RhiirA4_479528 [Rhizophagus irregularis]